MIPLPMKESIEKIIFELQKLIDQPTISNVNADEISRLKNIPTFIQISDNECNRLVDKWKVVLGSSVLKNVDTSGRELVAYFLEQQFKLNKGYLVESGYILEHNIDLQNIALPLICRIFNTQPALSRIKVNTVLKNSHYDINDIYVETFNVPEIYFIADSNSYNITDENLIQLIANAVVQKTIKTNKFLVAPIMLSRDVGNERIIYIRLVLKTIQGHNVA